MSGELMTNMAKLKYNIHEEEAVGGFWKLFGSAYGREMAQSSVRGVANSLKDMTEEELSVQVQFECEGDIGMMKDEENRQINRPVRNKPQNPKL
jgi:hypothetical protein